MDSKQCSKLMRKLDQPMSVCATLVQLGYGTPRKIRTLSKANLMRMPGIGGVTADAIIAALG